MNAFKTRISRWFRNQRGLTLIEVMVSLTLTAIVVSIVTMMMSQSDRQFRFVSQQEHIEKQYRMLTDGLSSIFRRSNIKELEIPDTQPSTNDEDQVLASWNLVGDGSGQLTYTKNKTLVWVQNKPEHKTIVAQIGALPVETIEISSLSIPIGEDITNASFTYDADSATIRGDFEWVMNESIKIKKHWQMNIHQWDQPIVPTPSDEPIPTDPPEEE